jgi:hypothetical protein
MEAYLNQINALNYMKSADFLSRLEILRFARDWQDVLYDRNVLFFWDKTCLADRITELESATGQPWLGRESAGRKVFRSDGYYINALDPVTLKHGRGYRYPTTVQIQGSAFARGLELETGLDEIETAIFGEVCPSYRRLGRVDLAFDVWIREGRQFTALELARAIHRWGRASEALARDWKTHIRKPGIDSKIVGAELIETFYLGSRSVAMMRAYRKDIEFEGNTAIYLKPAWRARGWDETGVVLRIEFEIKREYVRTHALPNGKPLTSLKWDDWTRALGAILNTLVSTVVHCPNYDPEHAERAESSQLWRLLQTYASFTARAGERLTRFYAEPDEVETALDLERAIWRAAEVLGESEANRLISGALAPAVPRARARRANWENNYLWVGYHEKRVRHAERERRAIENGGQYEIEFGPRASPQGSEGERSEGGARAPARRARGAKPQED